MPTLLNILVILVHFVFETMLFGLPSLLPAFQIAKVAPFAFSCPVFSPLSLTFSEGPLKVKYKILDVF